MPKLMIDGVEVEVPKGTKVIEAARQAGIEIPFYCYHPGLSIAGNCRMCLVEIERMPKLQIACHTDVQDGMVVYTRNDRVLDTRKHVLEFLLVNHPVDCPVCDQAGECWLQDYYMKHGVYESRLAEDKIQKPKGVPVGPTVMLDAERCILCSRCVRFCDEVSKTSELGIVNRGDHSEIQVFPGKELDNPYSGNVVDICPVGALTDRDFRFKIRVWYLKSRDSICHGCSRGCNISVQYNLDRPHHGRGERVKRIKPRYNEKVNQWWMCDEGRYDYKFHDHNRVTEPVLRGQGNVQAADMQAILKETAQLLETTKGRVGIILSPRLSNETLFLAQKFFAGHLKNKDLFLLSPKEPGFEDDILIRADKNPNTRGAEVFGLKVDEARLQGFLKDCAEGKVEGLIVFGQDLLVKAAAAKISLSLDQLKWSVFVGSNHNQTSENVTHLIPAATHVEEQGTFTNFEGRVQPFSRVIEPLAEARPVWEILCEWAKQTGMHVSYESAEDIFHDLAQEIGFFKGMTYAGLEAGRHEIEFTSAPTIPVLEQHSAQIFHEHADKAKEIQD